MSQEKDTELEKDAVRYAGLKAGELAAQVALQDNTDSTVAKKSLKKLGSDTPSVPIPLEEMKEHLLFYQNSLPYGHESEMVYLSPETREALKVVLEATEDSAPLSEVTREAIENVNVEEVYPSRRPIPQAELRSEVRHASFFSPFRTVYVRTRRNGLKGKRKLAYYYQEI